ncbi:hypothetical protein EYZ11_004791 [Aspergillus tanneri]|uniref:Carboxyphosphonoenolpyruvate phosphonomutase-like protein n=1 Tax=Aspergillus tanneri TaxID=1220188 RepID=A0A4S3JJS3_9EURO|nr:uncharacterized protein ATNIH1004_006340 [Aspergillus tanneri]KAA8647646.1 hypothetical protein ATNIH1004_006340 [Aspergillus tanneri]THC95713.1 hypothetical protein EYZ11_004791 [Aspergillus tanneri]
MATQNDLAAYFRSLHAPGNPVVLTNVYDGATASHIANHPATKAIATASYAIAASQGIPDECLTLSQNLASIRIVASVLKRDSSDKESTNSLLRVPLTVDVQDGYDNVAQTVKEIIKLGAVGCNIEDFDNNTGHLRSLPAAVKRIQYALEAAREVGVPDFVVNARTDVLGSPGGTVQDAIERGKAFLEAGACTVFVWGPGGRGVSSAEIKELVAALGGKVNVKLVLKDGFLTVPELKAIGVARISVGPELWRAAMGSFKDTADRLLSSCEK